MNSNQKGKRGERELAKYLTELTGRPCRRGQQFSGSPDSPDVVGLDGLHIECKRHNGRILLKQWMEQAASECGDNVPIVCHREDGEGWLMTMRLCELMNLVGLLADSGQNPAKLNNIFCHHNLIGE